MIVGRTDVGATPYALASDTKRVSNVVMPVALNLAKVAAFIDGGGAGAGSQVLRAVVYDASDNLLAQSDEVVVLGGDPGRWIDFPFSLFDGHLQLPAGALRLGLHAGGATSNLARVYGSDPHGGGSKWNADTYSDGASAAFGASTPLSSDMSLYVAAFKPYIEMVPPETDLYFSRLPHPEGQAVLGLGGATPGSARLVDAGWHDTFIDPETGSVALVRDGSDLADLLGERIKVTTQQVATPRSVFAYVHNLADSEAFDWDLSLSRHLFGRIGLLADETLPVIVEVMA